TPRRGRRSEPAPLPGRAGVRGAGAERAGRAAGQVAAAQEHRGAVDRSAVGGRGAAHHPPSGRSGGVALMVNATLAPEAAERAAPGAPAARAGSRDRRRRHQAVVAYLFLAPTLLFFAVFLILPLGFALLLSMSRWAGFDLGGIEPVGLDNFAGLFADGS